MFRHFCAHCGADRRRLDVHRTSGRPAAAALIASLYKLRLCLDCGFSLCPVIWSRAYITLAAEPPDVAARRGARRAIALLPAARYCPTRRKGLRVTPEPRRRGAIFAKICTLAADYIFAYHAFHLSFCLFLPFCPCRFSARVFCFSMVATVVTILYAEGLRPYRHYLISCVRQRATPFLPAPNKRNSRPAVTFQFFCTSAWVWVGGRFRSVADNHRTTGATPAPAPVRYCPPVCQLRSRLVFPWSDCFRACPCLMAAVTDCATLRRGDIFAPRQGRLLFLPG